MPIKVGVIFTRKFRGRTKVCPDICQGIERLGDKVIRIRAEDYREPFSDVALFYGLDGNRDSTLTKALRDYKAAGRKAIYIDLGYWKQRFNGDRYGYHRFSINDRHPTAYFQNVKHPSDRADAVSARISHWKKHGDTILLCGMSQKCAEWEGFKFEEWEHEAVRQIRAVTDRRIVYRPKPNKDPSIYRPLEGTIYRPSRRAGDIVDELRHSWAVVSHHSNAGIDAICYGVPCFSAEGVTTKIGHTDLSLIESPYKPSDEERRQFINDVAYCQFNRPEMRDGTAWRHFKDEGLVP